MTSSKAEPAEDDLMDNTIVHGFQNLRVLTPYDFHQMDELVQDLNQALDETTRTKRIKHNDSSGPQTRKVKRKSKKRKACNNSVLGAGHMSEASESSIDEVIKGYMENVIQFSDSDDLILNGKSARRCSAIVKLSSHSISVAESDSFTEASPMRPGRRRRRFKRMAVDAQPSDNTETTSMVDYLNEQRLKRLKTLKPKLKIQEHKSEKEMDSETTLVLGAQSGDSQQATPVKCGENTVSFSGKRKRGGKNGGSVDGVIDEEGCSETSGRSVEGIQQSSSSSSVSSMGSNSSCESELFTDGGQDGDDEQSDFYHESGPACGIPGIIPWWEKDSFIKEEEENLITDSKFNMILNGSFQHMSKKGQRGFMSRLKFMSHPGREIRMGRRRLKDRKPGCSFSRLMPDNQGQAVFNRPIDPFIGASSIETFIRWCKPAAGAARGDVSGKKCRKPARSGCAHKDAVNRDCKGAVGWACEDDELAYIHSTCEHLYSNGGSEGYETKRRRKTPPNTPSITLGNYVDDQAEPIPESNVGSRMLQSMGWVPGSGLGPTGEGITQPVRAFKRTGRRGLGTAVKVKSPKSLVSPGRRWRQHLSTETKQSHLPEQPGEELSHPNPFKDISQLHQTQAENKAENSNFVLKNESETSCLFQTQSESGKKESETNCLSKSKCKSMTNADDNIRLVDFTHVNTPYCNQVVTSQQDLAMPRTTSCLLEPSVFTTDSSQNITPTNTKASACVHSSHVTTTGSQFNIPQGGSTLYGDKAAKNENF